MPRNLELALIGNGAIGLLVDSHGAIVWGCFPRFDGDATFCALLDNAPPGDERGIYAVELLDFSHAEQSYCPEHGRPRNTAVRSGGRDDRDHRLRAPVHPARARVPPHDPCPHGPPRERQPAHRHSAAAGRGLRPRAPCHHLRQQPHPLRHAGSDAAADDQRVADGHSGGTAVLPGRRPHVAARARRNRAERRGRGRPQICRGDDQVLARLGSPARHTVRMASRSHSCGDHAAAERLR